MNRKLKLLNIIIVQDALKIYLHFLILNRSINYRGNTQYLRHVEFCMSWLEIR